MACRVRLELKLVLGALLVLVAARLNGLPCPSGIETGITEARCQVKIFRLNGLPCPSGIEQKTKHPGCIFVIPRVFYMVLERRFSLAGVGVGQPAGFCLLASFSVIMRSCAGTPNATAILSSVYVVIE